jgi:hypothetical protein
MPIRKLLDPMSQLPHPILNGDGETWTLPIAIELIPIGAFFGGEHHVLVNKVGTEELELFSLVVTLSRPLLMILLMFTFSLLKGTDEAVSNVRDSVEVVSDLEGSLSGAGQVDQTRVFWGVNGSDGR